MPFRVSVFDKDCSHLEDLKSISVEEKILQNMLYNRPELLSATEIDLNYTKLIPLATEVSVGKGRIDLLLLTPEGRICIVETKLWENNEAYRTVIAQILEYAKDLTKYTFKELVETVTRKKGEEAQREFFKLLKKWGEYDEVELQENIIQSLANGRFLLLIVGDKIRPNVLQLSETIQSAPHLEFKLDLLEIHLYELDSERVLAVPSLVGQTVPETRAVVKIIYEEKKPAVEVTSIEPTAERVGDLTYKVLISSMPEGFADSFKPEYEEWVKQGYSLEFSEKSLMVKFNVDGKPKTVFEIRPYATHIYSKKYEENTKLPSSICQQYRDNIKESVNLVRLISNNRQFVQFKDLTIEDFALHIRETNKVIQRLAEQFTN